MKFLQFSLASLILVCAASCSSDDKAVTEKQATYPDSISLFAPVVAQNHRYQLEKQSPADYFRSDNEYVCTVDSNGLISSACCGRAKVYVYTKTGMAEVNVTVTPLYDTYTEPQNRWGASFAEMRRLLGSSYMMKEPSDTIVHLATAKYEKKATQCDYTFAISNGDTSLIATQLYIPQEYENEAAYFLLERYMLINSDLHILLDGIDEKTCKSIIQMRYYKDYAITTYYSFDYMFSLATKTGEATRTPLIATPWR